MKLINSQKCNAAIVVLMKLTQIKIDIELEDTETDVQTVFVFLRTLMQRDHVHN